LFLLFAEKAFALSWQIVIYHSDGSTLIVVAGSAAFVTLRARAIVKHPSFVV
jgi:hypothetical protein